MAGAVLPVSSDRAKWDDDEAAAIEAAGLVFVHTYGEDKGKKVLAPRPVVAKFLHICARTGLDPLARQIYCIGRWGSDGLEWSVQTGIDGFRVVAERTGHYAGQDAPEWLTADGDWVDVFVKAKHGDHPVAARVRAYRHDWSRPSVGIATWDEYVQTKRNGDVTAMWQQRGPGQLAKCAEALALRKLAPQDLSGLYTDDEMRGGAPMDDAAEVADAPASDRPRSRVAQLQASLPDPAATDADAPDDVEAADGPSAAPDADEAPDGAVAGDGGSAGDVRVVEAEVVDEPDAEGAGDAFACARCGRLESPYEDGLCPSCEDEIEAEMSADTEGDES